MLENYKPLGNRLIIKLPGKLDKTKGGIVIAEGLRKHGSDNGVEVVATGHLVEIHGHIKVGDRVLVDLYFESPEPNTIPYPLYKTIILDGDEYGEVNEHDVRGIYK